MQYNNNTEYRQCLRNFFHMNSETYQKNIQADWDAETIDEMSYDEEAASKVLDQIYESTKHNILFDKIYLSAAAKMMSLDPEIGLAVCMSYDYFNGFCECLYLYRKTPAQFTEDSTAYQSMMAKLA